MVSSKFMNQEIQMYNLVVWIITTQLSRSDCEWFKEVIYIICISDDDDDILWNGSEEDWNVSSECEEDEGTN